jgi:hypothetical protein
VKKFIVIFLLLQVLTNNAFAEELIKMPMLITHYMHHTKQHGDKAGFLNFLHKHYCDHHKADEHRNGKHAEDKDCDLPFKHCGGDCCLNLHSSVIACIPSFQKAECITFQINSIPFPIADDRIESLDICSIWQPPKIS